MLRFGEVYLGTKSWSKSFCWNVETINNHTHGGRWVSTWIQSCCWLPHWSRKEETLFLIVNKLCDVTFCHSWLIVLSHIFYDSYLWFSSCKDPIPSTSQKVSFLPILIFYRILLTTSYCLDVSKLVFLHWQICLICLDLQFLNTITTWVLVDMLMMRWQKLVLKMFL